MPSYSATKPTPDVQKIQDFVAARFPQIPFVISTDADTLLALTIDGIDLATFNALMSDLRLNFPGAFTNAIAPVTLPV